eukprot:TRINITY_DN91684_c0_g1_i1.p1 TRINITY_DN91684_c0_g1~~TRINITY_DN91684_c0_g1_i1.p1  ORF type:complete len:1552 (+),score=255.72 TRINITY_DN91684_c0_g1_i1:48-4658(+)
MESKDNASFPKIDEPEDNAQHLPGQMPACSSSEIPLAPVASCLGTSTRERPPSREPARLTDQGAASLQRGTTVEGALMSEDLKQRDSGNLSQQRPLEEAKEEEEGGGLEAPTPPATISEHPPLPPQEPPPAAVSVHPPLPPMEPPGEPSMLNTSEPSSVRPRTDDAASCHVQDTLPRGSWEGKEPLQQQVDGEKLGSLARATSPKPVSFSLEGMEADGSNKPETDGLASQQGASGHSSDAGYDARFGRERHSGTRKSAKDRLTSGRPGDGEHRRKSKVIRSKKSHEGKEEGAESAIDEVVKKHSSITETFAALKRSALGLHVQRVEELIDSGVSVNMPLREKREDLTDFSTLLHAVCDLPTSSGGQAEAGSVEVVTALILGSANVNPRSSLGCTPLMNACRHKNLEVAKTLISYRAAVLTCDAHGHSSMNWAVTLHEDAQMVGNRQVRKLLPTDQECSAELLDILLDAAAEEMCKGHNPASRTRSKERKEPGSPRSPQRVKTILPLSVISEQGGDDDELDFRDVLGCHSDNAIPPLLHAVKQRNIIAADFMLSCGAPPIWLREAVITGSLELVQLLLHFEADPADEDECGVNAIDVAVQQNVDVHIIELLRKQAHKSIPKRNRNETINSDQLSNNTPGGDSRTTGMVKQGNKYRPSDRADRATQSQARVQLLQDPTPNTAPVDLQSSDATSLGCCRCFRKLCLPFVCRLLEPFFRPCFEWMSFRCRKIFGSHIFQCTMFSMLFCALYLPDLWVLTDVQGHAELDILLFVCFCSFIIELFVQVVGFPNTYLFSFFFFTDLLGTLSLLLELSTIKSQLNQSILGQNTVVMRAARVAKLGARAGRITRLVKLLRFLPLLSGPGPGGPDESKHAGTARVISTKLIARVSTVVACLIIFAVQVLPVPGLLSYPTQDWSMQMWTSQLRGAFQNHTDQSSSDSTVIQQLIDDIVVFYENMNYFPHSIQYGEEVLWEISGPSRSDQSLRVGDGDAAILFDFASPYRTDAAVDLSMMTFAILMIVCFAWVISSAVSQHALNPLESMLGKLREMGRHIRHQADSIHYRMKKQGSSKGRRKKDSLLADVDEAVLLQDVMSKITAISTIKLRQVLDPHALPYLGQRSHHDSVQKGRHAMADSKLKLKPLSLEEIEHEHMYTWRFNPLVLKDGKSKRVCATLLSVSVPPILQGINSDIISAFVDAAEAGHLRGPLYHNWTHAVDITHSVFVMLRECSNGPYILLSQLEMYCLVVAAVCHDIGHPGFSNDFLIQTKHEMAMRYNDRSPLENTHCAILFDMLKRESMNIFGGLSKDRSKEARKVCLEAILNTDNAEHFRLVKSLRAFMRVHGELLESVRSKIEVDHVVTMKTWPPKSLVDVLWEPENRDLLRNSLLHFADISNPMKPFGICSQWAKHIMEEFFTQGDKMAELGLPVPALVDRSKANCAQSQFSFIEFIALPMVIPVVMILPPLFFLEEETMMNARHWLDEWISSTSPPESEQEQMSKRLLRLQEMTNASPQRQESRARRNQNSPRVSTYSADIPMGLFGSG